MSVSALCVGHASWDLCMQVNAYPAENSKAETNALLESGGGPAANAAWLLGRWGVPTALAAVVGQDDYGDKAVKELAEGGIDCRLVEQRAGYATPVSFIIVNRAAGSRTIINRKIPAAGLQLTRQMLDGLNPKLLLFDGHELEASLAALAAFPSATTVLDAGSLREGTSVLAGKVRYLVCSERFAGQVTGEGDVLARWQQCLGRLRELYRNVVVVTLGARWLGLRRRQAPGTFARVASASEGYDRSRRHLPRRVRVRPAEGHEPGEGPGTRHGGGGFIR